MSESKGIFLILEQRRGKLHETSLELITAGRKLCNESKTTLTAVLVGNLLDQVVETVSEFGIDRIIAVESPELAEFQEERWGKSIAGIIEKEKPSIIIISATLIGRSLSSRLSGVLDAGLVPDAIELKLDSTKLVEEEIIAVRPVYSGNFLATVRIKKKPQIVSLRPKSFPKAEKLTGKKSEVVKIQPEPGWLESKAKVIKFIPEETQEIDIGQADIIVSGGRGLGKLEGFQIIRQLAEFLKAGVGASRAAVDAEWIPYRHQVGQTGRVVTPKLYIACGISGAIQHLAGMRSSKIIVAINNDPQAPIFSVANIGIVGNLYELIPLIIQELKK